MRLRLGPAERWLWIWGIIVFSVLYGHFAKSHGLFPSPQISSAMDYLKALKTKASGVLPWYYVKSGSARRVQVNRPDQMSPGLTLISGIGAKDAIFADLIDAQGDSVHHWDLDWFRVWPDPRGLPKDSIPNERPGTHIHGILLSPNGDLTFNYEAIGLVQMDVCGRVKWRLPRAANHSLYRDDAGNLWTQEVIIRKTPQAGLPNYAPRFADYAVIEVSPQGRVLRRIPIFDLLQRNHLQGLLYMSATDNRSTLVRGDTLHVNDIDVFPQAMKADLFKPGDIMVSMRNVSTILVFDPATLVVKAAVVGHFVRQHDPDFVDGSTITVLDNNNLGLDARRASSRIVEYSFKTGRERVLFEGDSAHPFYTDFMGKHQHLPNGNMLLTEATQGRAIEIDPNGGIVWEYRNLVGPGLAGMIDEAQRIGPDLLSADRLKQLEASCPR